MSTPRIDPTLSAVNWVRQCVLFVLLVIWIPATVHCDLELIPGLSFLTCTEVEGTPHNDAGCAEDSCAQIESGFYQLEDNPPPILLPVTTAPFPVPASPELCDLVGFSEVLFGGTGFPRGAPSAPPGLAHVWQFTFRAALLPRAPSLLS